MADEYIVVGASNGKLAGHASTIDSLLRVYKDGRTEETKYHSSSETNPGQDVLQEIDANHSDAKAVITGKMQGPENYDKRAIINEDEDSIERVVEKYKSGEYDAKIDEHSLEEKTDDEQYDVPKRDGSGKGVRANKGRNPECDEEDYEEIGKGSGTKYGRSAEGKPRQRAYESESSDDESDSSESEEGETEESSEEGSSEGSGSKE